MYNPVYAGPIQGYVANSIPANLWKVDRLHTRDDLMQESYLVFVRCASKYPVIDTPQHFMALFKMAWSRHLIDLAKKTTKVRGEVSENQFDADEGAEWHRETPGDLDNEGILRTMIRQAPREVVMVLNLFLTAPAELIELAMSTWASSAGRQADPNEFVCQALGLPPGSTPIDSVRKYLG